VFDCSVFVQALVNPRGPAGACLAAAQDGRLTLFVSDFAVREIQELPTKLPGRLRVTREKIEAFVFDLGKYAVPVDGVPEHFAYPRDPDDAHYVNLALAADARLIVSRDRDLLDLVDVSHASSAEFRSRYPSLRIVDPATLARELQERVPTN
jgi:putative PIN family toxin of toxin-antitoxin system